MQKKIALVTTLSLLLLYQPLIAQEHHAEGHAESQFLQKDTLSINNIKELFTRGSTHGHVRNYFMATLNRGSLSDNYANAIGAEIGYRTASFHGFSLGFAGLFTYNLFSSDISEPDPISLKHPKLELELFDVEDPENKADLDRLDELYLEYSGKHLLAKVGRFGFHSPLMNPQDTRMKPYSFQGGMLQLALPRKSRLTLAWFDHFSPRSTVAWFKADEAIGIFSQGNGLDGAAASYAHHTATKGVAVAGLQLAPHRRLQTEIWHYWIENISHNSYGRAVLALTPRLKAGIEGLYQFKAGQGGNASPALAYFPHEQQWLAGGMLAYDAHGWQLSLNYLHAGKEGRFLFPREWGREQFFATLPRGRIEGLGKARIITGKVRRQWSGSFSSELALSRAWLPPITAYAYNKYGASAYWGWVADIHYHPLKPVLNGLSFRLLYVGRQSPDREIPLEDMYYNTNFHNLNFVTQITF